MRPAVSPLTGPISTGSRVPRLGPRIPGPFLFFLRAHHRGIAARHFQKNFVLADGVEIEGAELEKGLLSIFLIRKNLELRVKTIKIIERN